MCRANGDHMPWVHEVRKSSDRAAVGVGLCAPPNAKDAAAAAPPLSAQAVGSVIMTGPPGPTMTPAAGSIRAALTCCGRQLWAIIASMSVTICIWVRERRKGGGAIAQIDSRRRVVESRVW